VTLSVSFLRLLSKLEEYDGLSLLERVSPTRLGFAPMHPSRYNLCINRRAPE